MAKLNTKKHKKYDKAMLRKIRKMVFYAEKDIKKGKISEATLLLDEIMKMKHLSDNMSVEEMYINYNEASKMIEQLKQMATLVEDHVDVKIDDQKNIQEKIKLDNAITDRENYETDILANMKNIINLQRNSIFIGLPIAIITGGASLYYFYQLNNLLASEILAGLSVLSMLSIGVLEMVGVLKKRKRLEDASPPNRLFTRLVRTKVGTEVEHAKQLIQDLLSYADHLLERADEYEHKSKQLKQDAEDIINTLEKHLATDENV